MHIGLCTPVTFEAFRGHVADGETLPADRYDFAAELALAYHQRGHEVSVVSWSRGIERIRSWRGRGLAVVAVPMRNLSTGLRQVVRDLSRETVALHPDVIHAHWLYECADAALRTGIPTLVTARDAPWRIARMQRSAYWWFRALYAQCCVLPRIRFMSTLSPHMAEQLKRFHACRVPVDIVPNGIAFAKTATAPRHAPLSTTAPCILMAAAWDANKNVAAALRAFALLRLRWPSARLVLHGRGLEAGGPASLYAEGRGLEAGVEWRGHVARDHVLRALREEADVLLHTAREESFGMSVLEAMASGVPCIAGFGCGAMPWLLDNGHAGCLVDVHSPADIMRGLDSVLSDARTYAAISAAGWQRARTVFSLDCVVESYLRLLSRVAGLTDEAVRNHSKPQ